MRMCEFVARASAVLFALPLETVELQLDSVLLHTDVANTTMRMLLRSHVGDTTHIAVGQCAATGRAFFRLGILSISMAY